MRQKFCTSILVALAVLAALPFTASAQSVIAGVVKDDSGAVLPGVTVEASSPALIERVRSVATDGQGRYRIVDLRPGTYKVTFALPGFTTLVRDSIQLPTDFTATVDASLKVGAVQETVTVSGQASTVDIQQATKTEVMSQQ